MKRIKVLFWTTANFEVSAFSRIWFYNMYEEFSNDRFDADLFTQQSLSEFSEINYDVVLLDRPNPGKIREITTKFPNALVGAFNVGGIGLNSFVMNTLGFSNHTKKYIIEGLDFIIVPTFTWRDLILHLGKPVYVIQDYVEDISIPLIQHKKCNQLTLGYHGNISHYVRDFRPHVANALRKLSKEFDISLKVITNPIKNLPHVRGVKTEFVKFRTKTFDQEVSSIDIGLAPGFANFSDLAKDEYMIRNPNRANTFLLHGIPSVASPNPASADFYSEGVSILYAMTEDGWYSEIKKLISNPDLRNSIGSSGNELVRDVLSKQNAITKLREVIEKELAILPIRDNKYYTKNPPKDLLSVPYRIVRRLMLMILLMVSRLKKEI